MKAFVINLDKDVDRLNQFQKDWSPITSVNIERFPAVMGKNIRHTDRVSEHCQSYCSNGMIGCYASHLAIMQKMIDNNIPQAVIFEDDAYPVQNFDVQFRDILTKYIPEQYDVLLLGHGGYAKNNSSTDQILYIIKSLYTDNVRTRMYKKINPRVSIPFNALCTYAYIISLQGAKKIVNNYNTIKYHVDEYLFSRPDLHIYAVEPHIVFTKDSDTSLGNEHSLKIPMLDDLRMFDNNTTLTWILHCVVLTYKDYNICVWHILLFFLLLTIITLLSFVSTLNTVPLVVLLVCAILFFSFMKKFFV